MQYYSEQSGSYNRQSGVKIISLHRLKKDHLQQALHPLAISRDLLYFWTF